MKSCRAAVCSGIWQTQRSSPILGKVGRRRRGGGGGGVAVDGFTREEFRKETRTVA